MIPPKTVQRAIFSKILTKQPSSVPTSHLVVTLSLYIFWYFLFLVIAISAIFMLFLFQNYHFNFHLVAFKVSPKYSNKAIYMIPPKSLPKAVSSKFLTKPLISVLSFHSIYQVLFVLNDCYMCHIHVIFIQNLSF